MQWNRILLIGLGIALMAACDAQSPAAPPPTTMPPSPTEATTAQPETADFGKYGPFRIGMTADEVLAVANGRFGPQPDELADGCRQFIDPQANSHPADSMVILLTANAGNRVVGIRLPIHVRTTRGVGYGFDEAEVRQAYADEVITESDSQMGREILVKEKESDSYLGFSIGSDGHTIVGARVGVHDFVANYELCSG